MTIYTYDNLEHVGRLGNQLFQIAATIGKSVLNAKDKAYIKPDWEYIPYFSVPESFFRVPHTMGSDVIEDGGTEYFQELHYFEHITDEIRRWFRPSDEAMFNLTTDESFDQFWRYVPVNPSCSVHIRRGDYLKTPDHFPLPSADYFKRAMADVADEEPGTHFFIFSDDIQWCKENLPTGDYTHYMDGSVPRPVEVVDRIAAGLPQDQWDMFLMAECDRHIISNSTFSWWGAFLSGDDRVIYPSRWFGPHPAVRDIPWRKMIPESWIEVEV